MLSGTAEIPDGKVRMLPIIWRYKLDPEEIAKRKDFVLASGHFESVELLNNSHWSIYTIERDYVLFVLLPEPIYSYNISEYPFIFVPLFERALAVAEMKRSEFLKFAEKLGKQPQPKTILFTNTARCGSTLLGKMLHRMQTIQEKAWIVLRLQFYAVYLVLQWIFQKVTEAVRMLSGTAEIPDGKVRMLPIIWRYKLDPEEIAKRKDFVLASGHFESVELLNNSHWSIYTIERDYVLFVLLPEPIYSYNISEYPFIFVPLFERALAVAEMKRSEFLKFAEKLGKQPQPKTILFTNTARCGSTLLGKMLHRPGVSVCYAEHPALTNLSIALGEELMTEAEVRDLLHAAITCLRSHLPAGVLCVLKTQSFEARLVPLCEGISNLKHVFMFRKKGLLSVEKVERREEFLYTLMLELYKYSPFLARYFSTLIAGEGRWIRQLNPGDMRELAAIMYASPLSDYEKNKKMYCHPIVWFHEIMNDTENVLNSLFAEIEIPLSYVRDAIECKNADSQQGTFLSSQKLTHIKFAPISETNRATFKIYAEKMGLPEDVFEVD
ncbi:hypothetical protein OESDEN_08079 [Oesophagostomum dentatum]|uniref:Sulfotransferase domain-containing protein n=1 Tax=Oesophagostomum dentatum TaxID=61180 RepID=A0A0B1T481_OESDE|nr:hypothetical protein OESDEN_08079 [Oesophagostomum dentatum]